MSKIAEWLKKNRDSPGSQVMNEYYHNKRGIFSWTGLKKLWDDYTGNSVIDKQLAAQKAENESIMQKNLELANNENAANLAQWYRENEYNTPAAQKARLEAAGLNADMMYSGGISNTSASSPSLTAGSPAQPMDWSSLGNKQTFGATATSIALDLGIKAAQLKRLNKENKYIQIEKELGLTLNKQDIRKNYKELQLLTESLQQAKVQTQIQGTEQRILEMEAAYRSDTLQKQLDLLAEELKLKKEDVWLMCQARTYRLLDMEMSAKLKEADLKWNDPQILEEFGGKGAASFFKILLMLIK